MVTRMKDEDLMTPDVQNTTKNYSEAQRVNMDYLRKHYKELIKKYPNHWVIILDGKVVVTERNPDRLVSKLSREKAGDKMVYYLASPKKRMLL
jgi:hypothetical protein